MQLKAKYESEIGGWLKQLERLQQENVALKHQVADFIKQDRDGVALERVEYFLNSFIDKDTVLALIRHDLVNQLKSLAMASDIDTSEQLSRKQQKLGADVTRMDQEFAKLQSEFANYIKQFVVANSSDFSASSHPGSLYRRR